jgi:hypothetical protein
MFRALIPIMVVICLMGAGSAVGADERYPTNLDLIERTVKVALDSMDVRPPAGLDPDLEIDAGSGSEASWLLDNILKDKLLQMGWRIRANPEASDSIQNPDGDYSLRIQIIDLGLSYGRSWRRYVLGGKVVERVARVSLYYELADNLKDEVLISSNVKSELVDVVPASLLPSLSNDKYTFASPGLDKTQWDRYLEAGLVITIVGVLVYLFYSNKTAS